MIAFYYQILSLTHLTDVSRGLILDSSKLKEFADDIKFDKNDKCFQMGRKLVMSNLSFSHSVFKILVLQTCKNQGLLGKRLISTERLFILIVSTSQVCLWNLFQSESTY